MIQFSDTALCHPLVCTVLFRNILCLKFLLTLKDKNVLHLQDSPKKTLILINKRVCGAHLDFPQIKRPECDLSWKRFVHRQCRHSCQKARGRGGDGGGGGVGVGCGVMIPVKGYGEHTEFLWSKDLVG